MSDPVGEVTVNDYGTSYGVLYNATLPNGTKLYSEEEVTQLLALVKELKDVLSSTSTKQTLDAEDAKRIIAVIEKTEERLKHGE